MRTIDTYVLTIITTEILVAPQTQHLLLNSANQPTMATFFCQASGVNSFWLINGTTVEGDGSRVLKQMGMNFIECIDLDFEFERNNVFSLTLQIPTVIAFNNTNIRCTSVINSPGVSGFAYLIIQGMS